MYVCVCVICMCSVDYASFGSRSLGLFVIQIDKPVTMAAVKSALEVGYRHFDTAFAYSTEGALGEVINECINSKLISRDDVFITTKV